MNMTNINNMSTIKMNSSSNSSPTDGNNLRNGKWSIWGTSKNYYKDIKFGDILWLITNKTHGGKIIGMATYRGMFDRTKNHTFLTNDEQNWVFTREVPYILVFSHFYEFECRMSLFVDQNSIIRYNREKHGNEIIFELYNVLSKCTPSNKYRRFHI